MPSMHVHYLETKLKKSCLIRQDKPELPMLQVLQGKDPFIKTTSMCNNFCGITLFQITAFQLMNGVNVGVKNSYFKH